MKRIADTGAFLVPALLALAACAPTTPPVPVEDAQNLCVQLALDQERDSKVRVGIGVGTGSWRGGYGSIGISTDAPVGGRDPARAYRDCVIKRSGQAPVRDFYEQLGQRGGTR